MNDENVQLARESNIVSTGPPHMMAQYNTSVLAGTQQKGDRIDDVIPQSTNKRELTSCGLSKESVLIFPSSQRLKREHGGERE